MEEWDRMKHGRGIHGRGFLGHGVKCVRAGVGEQRRCKEGVGLLMNVKWIEAINDFVCVNSSCMHVKFKFAKVRVAVVIA